MSLPAGQRGRVALLLAPAGLLDGLYHLRRNARHDAVGRNIFGDNCAGRHHGIFPMVTLGMMVTLVPIHAFFRRRQQEKSVIDTPVKCPHDPPRYFHGHHVDGTAEYGSGRLNKSGWLRHQVGQRLHKAALSI
jgi:hypothetical protein